MEKNNQKAKKKPKSRTIEKIDLNDIQKLKSKLQAKKKDLQTAKNQVTSSAQQQETPKEKNPSIKSLGIEVSSKTHEIQSTEERKLDPTLGIKPVPEKIRAILPDWIDKPYMYVIPKDETRKKLFLEEWSSFIIGFMEKNEIFIIPLRDFKVEYPFKNPFKGKKLSKNQLQEILDYLVEQERAEWLDRSKTRIKIFWLSHEEIADEIFQWAFDYWQEIIVILELKKVDAPWSKLPTSDLKKAISILIEENRAEWIDKREGSVKFYLDS